MDKQGTAASAQGIPLVVDLDGTLVATDTLVESTLALLTRAPLDVLRLPRWLLSGRAVLKARITDRVVLDAASLPYTDPLLDWLRQERASGRPLVLCTASDSRLADAIARHLGLFDEVLASDGERNVAGRTKAELLVARFGEGGFDYAGNARADIDVWRVARGAIVVNADRRVLEGAKALGRVTRVIPPAPAGARVWVRALRVHQWVKNLLLAVPLLAAHQYSDATLLQLLLLAFCAFCLCSSAVYVTNDLLDLDSDRKHPHKRSRPFAAGTLPVWKGLATVPLLAVGGFLVAHAVGPSFLGVVSIYFAVTLAYSLWLKRWVLVDCMTLTGLYTLRIVAGAVATGIPPSFWLLAFSMFLFLSLAFAKRYAELQVQEAAGSDRAHGRGYYVADRPLLLALGIAAAYAAVLVLALYLDGDVVVRLYGRPEWLWAAVPVMLFWMSWVWIKAHRGEMHDDPIAFALRDPTSLACAGLLAVTFVLAAAPV